MPHPELERSYQRLLSHLPELQRQRNKHPFANGLYEGVDDWCHLARRALDHDTRVDFPGRAAEELQVLTKLQELLKPQPDIERQTNGMVLQEAQQLLSILSNIQAPEDGHLQVLKVLRTHFAFLCNRYEFKEVSVKPTGITFSSGIVCVRLEVASQSSLSFSLTHDSEPDNDFWIEDLLFMAGDERHKTVPHNLNLRTKSDVESWFAFLADMLTTYGSELLSNENGAFEKLAEAQRSRDAEYVNEMNLRHQEKQT